MLHNLSPNMLEKVKKKFSLHMAMSGPVVTTHTTTPCRLQHRRSQINCTMFPQASHGVVIANSQLMSCYISETVQASSKVTIECECEVICDLSNGVISNNLE